MPRPPRDYGVALRADIAKLDQKIRDLAVERARKLRMLAEHERTVDVDIQEVLERTLKPKPAPTRRRRK